MGNILILDAGTQGLALVKSLHDIGHRIVLLVVERGNYADSSRYVNKLYFCHYESEDENYLRFVTDVIRRESIDVVIPVGDSTAAFLSKNRSVLQCEVKFKIPSYANFIRGYDKNQLMNVCREKKYPHPYTIDLSVVKVESDEVRNFDFPGMLKPNCTTGGRGMVKVSSYTEMTDRYYRLRDMFGEYHLQKFIRAGGKQEKIQLYIDENKNLLAHTVLQKLRWYPNQGGSNTCAVSIEDNNMVGICYQILKDIDWVGFADFDLIQNPDNGEMLIMEINPRVPACIKGAMVAGVNWAEIIVNDCLGFSQKRYMYRTGVVLRHLGLDFLWFLHAENRWICKPNWFHLIGDNIHYQDVSNWTDPMPFIIGTYHNIKKLFDSKFKQAKQL